MLFSEFGLAEEIVRAVKQCGYDTPTPIQIKAIPAVLEGRDLLAGAQTGTGKTAGFVLPILQRLSKLKPRRNRPVRALVVTPTRELAAQVEASVRQYGRHLPIRSTTVFGGVSFNVQADKMRRGVDILVATPGRLLDHLDQGTIDLSRVEVLVLDEADRMLDMGFIKDIKRILRQLPAERQNLLFSATFSKEIRSLAERLLDNPATIEAPRENLAADTVSQTIHPVDRHRKRELLAHLVNENNWYQLLVFTRTKHGADRLVRQLAQDGIDAAAIHGNKSQNARTRALANFKRGELRALVATDIAARGIDIVDLPYVVNFDLPNVSEDYVHRIGRTGRAGSTGEARSLVSADEIKLLRDIERLIDRQLPQEVIAGFEPGETPPARTSRPPQRRQGKPGGPRRKNARRGGTGKSSGSRGRSRRA